ncbi:MAG: protein kinase, partial [Bacteroidota bacterium]
SQIIHRDIKPENIFVDNSLNLKIGDFGLALSQEDNFVTNPYSIVGTPSYMSPEQVRGSKLNAQSDLFSAGVVLYEMYAGKNPLLKENVSLTLNEIMAFDEDIISKGLNEQEQEIKDVIFHLIRKSVKDRYSTALEALNDLGVSIEQPTLVIKSDERLSAKTRLKPMAAIASLALIVITFLLLKIFDSTAHDATQNTAFRDTTTQQNTKPTAVELHNNKEKTDTANLNRPMIDDQKTINENAVQTEQKPNMQEPQPGKTAANGWLRVRAVVGTRVIIDGESYPEALSKIIYLPEGEYTVKFENDDFPSYTEKVKIDAKQETLLRADFNNLVAFVTFDVRPEAQIYIDGSKRGECPPVLRMIPLKPGVRRITLRNSNSKDVDTTINVNKGDTLIFSYKFKK